jgi:hypothetical protein
MILVRLGICLSVFGICLYSYLNTQNQLTQLRMQIPQVENQIKLIQEENRRLAYEIDKFENPAHLMELVHQPEYSYLKHPLLKEILTVPEALASN